MKSMNRHMGRVNFAEADDQQPDAATPDTGKSTA